MLFLDFTYSSTINMTHQIPSLQMEFNEDHWLCYGWILVKGFRSKSAFFILIHYVNPETLVQIYSNSSLCCNLYDNAMKIPSNILSCFILWWFTKWWYLLCQRTLLSSYHQNTATFKVVELHVSITCQPTRSVTIFVYASKSM